MGGCRCCFQKCKYLNIQMWTCGYLNFIGWSASWGNVLRFFFYKFQRRTGRQLVEAFKVEPVALIQRDVSPLTVLQCLIWFWILVWHNQHCVRNEKKTKDCLLVCSGLHCLQKHCFILWNHRAASERGLLRHEDFYFTKIEFTWFHMTIWETACRQHLKKGVPSCKLRRWLDG